MAERDGGLEFLVGLLQSRSHIYCIADGRILEHILAADIAGNHTPRVDSSPTIDGLNAMVLPIPGSLILVPEAIQFQPVSLPSRWHTEGPSFMVLQFSEGLRRPPSRHRRCSSGCDRCAA